MANSRNTKNSNKNNDDSTRISFEPNTNLNPSPSTNQNATAPSLSTNQNATDLMMVKLMSTLEQFIQVNNNGSQSNPRNQANPKSSVFMTIEEKKNCE